MAPHVERVPPYAQVLRDLRTRIMNGELAPGSVMPSAQALADQWGISRATASKTLTALRAEGLIETRQGTEATVLGPRSVSTGSERIQRMRTTGSAARPGEHSEITEAKLVPAPEDVATALATVSDAVVVRRRRRFADGDGTVAISTSWLDGALADVAPELIETARIPGGTLGAVERATGRRASQVRDTHSARLATDSEADALGIAQPAAVLYTETLIRDQNGEVIELGQDVSAAGRRWIAETELV
jgi:DNA-binding GntR family transcriptional regulator